MLDDQDDEDEEAACARVRDVSLAESLFGTEFDVRSHDLTVRRLAVHFKEDRKKAAARYERKRVAAKELKRKQARAKRKLPKLEAKIRRWLLKKGRGVTSAALITRFEGPLVTNGFTKAQFRTCLVSVARLDDGLWTAK